MLHEAGKYGLIRLSLFIGKYRQEMSRVIFRIASSSFPKEKRRSGCCFDLKMTKRRLIEIDFIWFMVF